MVGGLALGPGEIGFHPLGTDALVLGLELEEVPGERLARLRGDVLGDRAQQQVLLVGDVLLQEVVQPAQRGLQVVVAEVDLVEGLQLVLDGLVRIQRVGQRAVARPRLGQGRVQQLLLGVGMGLDARDRLGEGVLEASRKARGEQALEQDQQPPVIGTDQLDRVPPRLVATHLAGGRADLSFGHAHASSNW